MDASTKLTHLQRLEAESIHIVREVVAKCDNPVMLYSMGKDSAVMQHLAKKAFIRDMYAPGGEETPCPWASFVPPRRRQSAPRPQQGFGLHRRRPRGEHPSGRRVDEPHGGCRSHRSDRIHLAVPRRREMARSLVGDGEFIEIFVDTPLDVAESRDVKRLYRKARRGELSNLTGIDLPYEPPESPELVVNTVERSADEAADKVISLLQRRGPDADALSDARLSGETHR